MRYLTLVEIVELQRRLVREFGGVEGIHNQHALEAAIAQPMQTFGGGDLYAGLVAKAAALAFFLATGHAFRDGNKRIAHAAMEITLLLNGVVLTAPVAEQESIMLALASGKLSRGEFTRWVEHHVSKAGT